MCSQILFYLAFASAGTRVASAQEPVLQPVSEPIPSHIDNDVSIESGGINERLCILFCVYYITKLLKISTV